MRSSLAVTSWCGLAHCPRTNSAPYSLLVEDVLLPLDGVDELLLVVGGGVDGVVVDGGGVVGIFTEVAADAAVAAAVVAV